MVRDSSIGCIKLSRLLPPVKRDHLWRPQVLQRKERQPRKRKRSLQTPKKSQKSKRKSQRLLPGQKNTQGRLGIPLATWHSSTMEMHENGRKFTKQIRKL